MRTTLELDRRLLEAAKEALGTSTLTETIEEALRAAVSRHRGHQAWERLRGSERSWSSLEEFHEARRGDGYRTP